MFTQSDDPEAQRHKGLRIDPSTTDSSDVEKDIVLPLQSGLESGIPNLEHVPSATPTTDDAPDGGYGWVCVVCMLIITANTWGVNGVCICGQH